MPSGSRSACSEMQLVQVQRRSDVRAQDPRTPWDVRGLEATLRRHLQGEVRFDAGSRALYATDGSNYRQVPLGVVIPKSIEDVLLAVDVCRQYGAPILSRGGGTSLAGQTCN